MADQSLPIGGVIDVTRSKERKQPFFEWLAEWFITVDHKKLGILYVVYAMVFLLIGGLEALVIRLQLAVPNNHIVGPQVYDELFTMHGTTMVFLMGMPILIGLANYIVPLQIGARDMAFPRLNAFSFWMTAFGGLLLYYSYIGGFGLYGVGTAPDFGWFAYAPLTSLAFARGRAPDYWAIALIVMGWGSLGAGVNIITTTLTMRCKGMKLMRMPLFTWLMLVVSAIMIVAIPCLTAAQGMLMLDRYLGAHFFDTQAGGSAILWMHFFWIFGHPEVYILALPAFGLASEIIPVFSRKAIFGYPAMVAASVGIGFLSFGVWAHHMFTVGMSGPTNAFFVIASMLVGIPTGIKIFNWLATIWGGKIWFATPMLFSIAFIFQFLIGGLTGVMLASAPWDWQLHNSYFVVAHFHYILVGAIVFMVFAAIYYWFPKVTGKMLDERLGKWHFWLTFVGFWITFMPQYQVGLKGMPRRVAVYPTGLGWQIYNQISTIGAFLIAAGFAALHGVKGKAQYL